MNSEAGIIEKIARLNVYTSGERRAPHKPLLLLIALSSLLQNKRELPFNEVEERLRPLLNNYAPPVKSRHQPELPYWHLQNDHLWVVTDAESLERQAGGFPQIGELRRTSGHLPEEVATALLADRTLLANVVKSLSLYILKNLCMKTFWPQSVCLRSSHLVLRNR